MTNLSLNFLASRECISRLFLSKTQSRNYSIAADFLISIKVVRNVRVFCTYDLGIAIKSTQFYFVTLKQELIFAIKPSEFSKKSSNDACSKRRHIYIESPILLPPFQENQVSRKTFRFT